MNKPHPPIFVVEGLDVSVYRSTKAAEIDLEPIDIQTGGLLAYDGKGRKLILNATHWRVTMSLGETEPLHANELHVALRKFLRALKDPVADDQSCDLNRLVEYCHKFVPNA